MGGEEYDLLRFLVLLADFPPVSFFVHMYVCMCFVDRTPFPVLLQPVKRGHDHGGDKRQKCVQFALVAAPHVKNVTYIKVRGCCLAMFSSPSHPIQVLNS